MWPVERFLDLANRLVSTCRARILLILGPAEEELKEVFLRITGSEHAIVLDTLPLPQLGAVLERCHVFVGNDSGVAHLAAALGVSVVAIFGPTDPVRWAPRGENVRVIRRAISCSPCEREIMARCDRRRCLLEISVDEVYTAVYQWIGGGVESI